MPAPQKISFAELGDKLQDAWEKGKIGEDVRDCILAGFLPIADLREKMRWLIERSDEEGYVEFTQL